MIRLSRETDILFTEEPVVVAYIQEDSIHRRLRSKALSFLVILRKHATLFADEPRALQVRLFGAGRYLYKIGRYRGASICMARAIRLRPLNPKPWAGLLLCQAAKVRRMLETHAPGSGAPGNSLAKS